MVVDLSKTIASLVVIHNDGWNQETSNISTKWLKLGRAKSSPLLEKDSTYVVNDEHTGKISKVFFKRELRRSTENSWDVVKLIITTSPSWSREVSFECFLNDVRQESISCDEMKSLNNFYFNTMPDIQKLFNVREKVTV